MRNSLSSVVRRSISFWASSVGWVSRGSSAWRRRRRSSSSSWSLAALSGLRTSWASPADIVWIASTRSAWDRRSRSTSLFWVSSS